MDEMILEEGNQKKTQRLCCGISLQSIFNFIVVVGLLLLCSSVIFKFQQIDNKLKGLPTLGHETSKPEASSLTDDKPSCEIQCERGPIGMTGERGPIGKTGEQGVQGRPGRPGPPGPKYVP
ncbi:collagen alpha-1(XIII) chain-like, partial [Anneissia japonica]|uniref:collagen alpha-1(XIII) chain-like n=1 Tax=Anneissia japonica TaxID=1529436 RepID=UPI0014258F9C